MKIPKVLNIFSIEYQVVIEKDYFIGEDGETLLTGECDTNNKILRIRKAQDSVLLQTLIHEMSHAICNELGLYVGEHDETFIDRIALGLTDTLIRNKFIKE